MKRNTQIKVDPYRPSKCDKHPRKVAGVWAAPGTVTAQGVVSGGGRHACEECWTAMFPAIGLSSGRDRESILGGGGGSNEA